VANTRSAKKRLRQSEERRARNRAARTRLKSAVKAVRATTDSDEATERFRKAVQLLDRAAVNGIVHPNRAARVKSRLANHVQEVGGTP
jgi:small subunit ribosomal protein S20